MIDKFDTIYALSTLLGKSGVAIIRVSGQGIKEIANAFGFRNLLKPNKVFRYKLFSLIDPKILIDDCLILYFKGPKSFTGEDIIEFHTHGSIAVIKRLIEELSQIKLKVNCIRVAEPGEFSKRAFLNNKMDLIQAEGLVALINSETEVQRQIAARQMIGEQSSLYDKWRINLIKILSLIEALIDFPTDEIPEQTFNIIENLIKQLSGEITNHISQTSKAEIIQRGVRIAILGEPNVGKSTFINQLVRREVAIVSDIAGTTRDVIEVRLDLKGFPVIVYDTAGIRESSDIIEREGVKKAYLALNNADLCLLICDASKPLPLYLINKLTKLQKPFMIFINKCDIYSDNLKTLTDTLQKTIKIKKTSNNLNNFEICKSVLEISLLNNANDIIKIIDMLTNYVSKLYTPSLEPLLTCQRHRELLEEALLNLNKFNTNLPLDIAAQHIRIAANTVSQIIGKIEVDEILDTIFSSFCIGK